jgi:LPS sulfotransferase NodH
VRTILVAATHRSGSYLACDWLSSVGEFPFPEEYFNYDLKTAREELRLSESVPSNKVLKALIDCRGETHGIFTVKAMWPAFSSLFDELSETNSSKQSIGTAALQWLKSPSILFVRRRDKSRQAVSFEIAKQTGIWRKLGGDKTRKSDLLYSYSRILACWDRFIKMRLVGCAFLKLMG